MKDKVKPPRAMIWVTLFVIAAWIVFTSISHRDQLPPAITIETKGQPTLGSENAKIHLVIFEEPKCCNCKDCTLQIFPQIKEEFIDTNLVRYTVIPVSFIHNSILAAEALYAVYYNDPKQPNDALFFEYLDAVYAKQPDESIDWVSVDMLVKYAKETSPEISLDHLKENLEKRTYVERVKQNTAYGKELMGGNLATPMLYINGIPVKDLNFDEVSRIIKLVLKKTEGGL